MGKIIFFTGGSRSGKSKFAEEYIYEQKYKNKIYFATAIAFDDEMQDRIERHIKRRGNTWKTIEGFKNLISLVKNDVDSTVDRDIDCDKVDLSVVQEIEDQIEEEMSNFLEFIRSKKTDCVFVTNEIGSGLVPDYPLGRHFRDICGRINQLVAKNSDEAYLAVSGIKVKIK